MCIAILKTKKGKIDDETLEKCFLNNNDGGGIAYALNGKLHIEKGFFDYKSFLKRIRIIEKKYNPTMLIHCRISTSGRIDTDNSHPHKINDNLCLIHNGILDITVPKKSKKSDTVLFIDKYLKDIKPDDLLNPTVKSLITKFINDNNKFVFLDNKGHYTICNEKTGKWFNGCWYSNDSYKTSNVIDYYEMYGYDELLQFTNGFNDDITVKRVKNAINKLSRKDFLRITDTPIIDKKNFKLLSENDYYNSNRPFIELEYLQDFDTDLYNYYLDSYYKIWADYKRGC